MDATAEDDVTKRIHTLQRPAWLRWSIIGSPSLLVALWLALSIVTPRFATIGNQVNILRHASVLMLAASAQTFAIIAGGLNIAVGSSAALAAVAASIVATRFGVAAGYAVGLATGVAFGLLLGVLIGWLRVNPIIGTIGLLAVARGIAFEISDGQPITGLPGGFDWLGNGSIGWLPASVVVTVLAVLVLHLFLTYTIWGRRIYAIGVDESSARIAGIAVKPYVLLAHLMSVSLAAFAGVMLASRVNAGMATVGANMSLETIAAVILGGNRLFAGEGSVLKTAVGVLIITTLGNGMDLSHVSPYLREILLGLIVIAVVFVGVRAVKPR